MQAQGRRKTLVGEVVSNKMVKTVIGTRRPSDETSPSSSVMFDARAPSWRMTRTSICQPGDRVKIIESRPLSRHKRWRVMAILERAESQETRRNP